MNENIVALIPAAGRGSRMFSLTDENPKAMLPLHNKPLIGHHLDKLIAEGIKKVCIIIGYHGEKLVQYVKEFYIGKIDFMFVKQERTDGLATAVLLGIDAIINSKCASYNDKLLVVLGDTIIEDSLSNLSESDSFVGYHNVQDFKRWCIVTEENGIVETFYDKPQTLLLSAPYKAVIGVYYFTDIKLLQNSIKEIVENNITTHNEFQLSSAMKIYNNTCKLNCRPFEKWTDVGDLGAYMTARKQFTRFFNSIGMTDIGTIVKKSETHAAKIQDEIYWYNNIPNKLKIYTPAFIDSTDNSYELEFINFSPLQELFMFQMPEPHDWDKILDKTFNMIGMFGKLTTAQQRKSLTVDDYRRFYIGKTMSRAIEAWKDPFIADMESQSILFINGHDYKPLHALDIVKKNFYMDYILYDNMEQFTQIIHGDLFFGNMLYDINSETLKIVDPRGSFGAGQSIIGDVRYDLAKLYHSIYGEYDFISNGIYSYLSDENDSLEIHFKTYGKTAATARLIRDFRSRVERLGIDMIEILIITASLFLSMIPLHKENKMRQRVFYSIAVMLYNEVDRELAYRETVYNLLSNTESSMIEHVLS